MARKKAAPAKQEEPNLFAMDEGRQKALDATLADLTKRFGEGTIVRLGDAAHMVVETIPTGSLGLDISLGVGGVPRGRIIEIYGPESAGKCISKDTYLLTEHGMLTVEELFAHEGYKATCTSRVLAHQVGLVNENGVIEQTSHLTWNNRKPVKRITTHTGIQIEATARHPLRVMNTDGHIVWRHAEKLEVGDVLVLMRGTNTFGSDDLSADEAKLLGYWVADGALGDHRRIGFSNSDPEVIVEYQRLVADLLDAPIRSYAKGGSATIDHHINSVDLRALVQERYGLDMVHAADKTVPLRVRMAAGEAQIAFLRGYFELECSIYPAKTVIEVTSASRRLLQQVQLMLLNLGIVSLLREKAVDGVTYHRLTLAGADYQRFGEIIGFDTTPRQQRFAECESTFVSTNFDSLPFLGHLLRSLYDACESDRETNVLMYDYMGDAPRADLTYERLRRIIAHLEGRVPQMILPMFDYLELLERRQLLFDEITQIEADEMPTFDVVMPKTHSFWSNGMISHNTTLCLHIVAEAQKRGGICAFVDMEHALDPTHAARIGVDMDRLYVTQPDTGEQALEITESLVRSSALDVIVVDSVAALVPRAEIEGEMGDSHVGLQARLMSQALRKLSGAIKQSNVCVLFTNQLREKVGVVYGSPEVTTGGRALKFYASVRLEIRRVSAIKKGEETIGNRTKVRVTKNKVAAPFKETEFDIMFYEGGISKVGEILDLGAELGVVEKRGAFFRYNDGLLGQGRENAKIFLLENKVIADEIEDAIRANNNLPAILSFAGGDADVAAANDD